MARGAIAKTEVIKKISEAFGDNFIGEFDKKIFVWANENGEKVQIAISLTCPKTPIEVAKNVNAGTGDFDFSDDGPANVTVAVSNAPPAEITQEEKDNISALMERLGL